MMQGARRKAGQQGFGLIEILVSMLVLGVGILGMVGLQLNSMKFNHTASVRTQATFLAYDLSDRMRANRMRARAGDYDTALTANAPSGTAIAAVDLQQWKAALAAQLPAGAGAVERTSSSNMRITVQWDEGRSGGSATQQFVFETRL